MRSATATESNPRGKQPATHGSSWLMMVGLGLPLLAMAALVALVVYLQTFQVVLPGVWVGDAAVGALPLDKAAAQINAYWNETPHFVVSAGEQSWQVTPANIGLWVEPALSAQRAVQVGRGTGGLAQWEIIFHQRRITVEPVVVYNAQLARDVLTELAGKVAQPAQEAQLVRDSAGQWQALPGKTGVGLDVEAVLALLAADPSGVLKSGSLRVPVTTLLPQVADLSGQLARLQAYFQKPLHLQAYDAISDETIRWDLPQELLGAWLNVDDPYAEPTLLVDEARLQAYLAEWVSGLSGLEIELDGVCRAGSRPLAQRQRFHNFATA